VTTLDEADAAGLAPEAACDAELVGEHLRSFLPALASLDGQVARIAAWGAALADRLSAGSRLIVAGNGGSAAEAQHLTAELVGRFDGDRAAFSALALSAETSSVTAIGNDYGFDEVFARQVRAHARPGDIVLLLSTSGTSRNLIRAAEAAHACGATTWAMTGALPNRLALACHDAVSVAGDHAHVQECHLILIHALCRVFDSRLERGGGIGGKP
jgi:phosphoheptose isomerase